MAPGQGALAWISMGAAFVGMTLLTAPVAGLQAWTVLSGRPSLGWLVLVVGASWGALLAWAGLRWSATRTAARLPEILTAVSKA